MSRITKSVTFDDTADADLLAWIQRQMQVDARPGERLDFSRFVRGVLYRAFEEDDHLPAPATPLPDTLLADIRAVVEAAVSHALNSVSVPAPGTTSGAADDDDFSGLLLD